MFAGCDRLGRRVLVLSGEGRRRLSAERGPGSDFERHDLDEEIETRASVVLDERGRPVNEKDGLPVLARAAQGALGLHPSSATPGTDGSDAVKKILGAVTTIAAGLGELRNRGYGTGQGPAAARLGLRLRHAHLAVNAAVTWCQLLLDTLADRKRPGIRTRELQFSA